MDTKVKCKKAGSDTLTHLSGVRTVCGVKQIRKAILSGTAKEVFLAKNADPALTEPIEALCQTNKVPCTWVRFMADLGKVCGIEVGTAAAAAVE